MSTSIRTLDISGLVKQTLAESNASYQELAVRELARRLHGLSSRQLVRLDRTCRAQLPGLVPEEVPSFYPLFTLYDGWALAAVLSFHSNGYVREQIVAWLDVNEPVQAIPYLVIRMNDWVEPISASAQRSMLGRLRPELADVLIEHLPLLTQLGAWKRTDHRGFLKRLHGFLRSSETRAARERGMASGNPAVRRAMIRVAFEAEPTRFGEIIRRAGHDPDRALRRWALRQLCRADAEVTMEVLEGFLLDTDPIHRQTAQSLIGRAETEDGALKGREDLREFYLRALRRGDERIRAAVYGLGETGQRQDVERVLRYLSHPFKMVRRAAIYALSWLDLDHHVEPVIEALADPNRQVSGDAASALIRSAYLVLPHQARIRELAGSGPSSCCRKNAAAALEAGEEYQKCWG